LHVQVHFDNVKIPIENLLGAQGDGFKVAMNILNNGRFGIPASMTGCIRHCMQKAVDFANNRVQFGNKLREYGDVRRKISEMAMKHYIAEVSVRRVSTNTSHE
jgi:very long chain acyl-CoA dehydrogenase